MVKAHVLSFGPKLAPVKLLVRGGAEGEDFFSARRRLAPLDGRQPHAAPPVHRYTKVVNNLRVVNNLAMSIFIYSGSALPQALPVPRRSEAIAAFADAAIDLALRDELDSRLALMRRGEGLEVNRRHRAVLAQRLAQRPTRETCLFYTARMLFAPSHGSVGEGGSDSFHNDIIHERQTQTTHITNERYSTQTIRQESASPHPGEENARRIADNVFRRVEQKMRLDRERSGHPR